MRQCIFVFAVVAFSLLAFGKQSGGQGIRPTENDSFAMNYKFYSAIACLPLEERVKCPYASGSFLDVHNARASCYDELAKKAEKTDPDCAEEVRNGVRDYRLELGEVVRQAEHRSSDSSKVENKSLGGVIGLIFRRSTGSK